MALLGEFRDLSPEDAAKRFRLFLSERAPASATLVAKAAAAGLTLDESVPSLQPLWEWMAPQLNRRSRFKRRRHSPGWLVAGHPTDDLDSDSVELLDGLVSYLGEVFTTQTGLAWELETHDPSSTTYQHPVFAGGMFVPINVMNAALRRNADTGEADAQLMYWVGATVANTRASQSADPTAPTLDVAVEPSDLPGFDWEIWVDETAESVLGREAFDSLELGFAMIPHVTQVVHQDRELFLVRAESITKPELETAAQRAVDRGLSH